MAERVQKTNREKIEGILSKHTTNIQIQAVKNYQIYINNLPLKKRFKLAMSIIFQNRKVKK